MFNGYNISVWDEKILEIESDTQHWECTYCYWIVCLKVLKMITFMLVYFTTIKMYSKTVTLIISGVILVNSKESTYLEKKDSENTSYLVVEADFFMLDSRYLTTYPQASLL